MSQFNLADHFVDRNVAQGHGDRVALYTPDHATTYAELSTLVNRVAGVLVELGARRGDVVLLALSDGVEFVASWYAAQKIGAVTAEVYTFLQPKDYRYFLDYTEAPVVIAGPATLENLRAAGFADRQVLVVDHPQRQDSAESSPANEHDFASLVAQAPTTFPTASTTWDDVAIWKFTTGSTGMPKACLHTAASPIISHESYALGVLGISADDVVLPVPK